MVARAGAALLPRAPLGIVVDPPRPLRVVEPIVEDRPLYLRMLGLALRRPRLLPHLLGAAWAFRSRDWYRRPPFLPLPSAQYLRWRMETAYGDPDAVPPEDELVAFLEWGSDMRRRMGRRS